jgi:putative hydrolase of the HAD superfamily
MIRAILFDLGNVIIPFDFKRGYAALATLCAYDPAEIPKRIRSTGLVPLFETGKIGVEEFVDRLTRALGITPYQFRQCWSAIFLPGTLVPESAIEALRERHKIIAVSNTNELHFEEVRANYPILEKFDDFVLSYRAGFAKPDPRIYTEAVEKAGCAPDECLFIDDVEAYVEAARQCGIQAIHFHNYAQLESAWGGLLARAPVSNRRK